MNRSDMKLFLNGLNEHQMSQVLKILLDNNSDLLKKVYDIAVQAVSDVDHEEIADDVYYELNALDLDMLSSRSGRTQYGYVSPDDAASELFEEAITPFIDEMKNNLQRALYVAAKNYCIGIVKGLMRYEEDSNSDLKEWVIEEPGGYIESVVDDWKKGNPSKEDIIEVMSIVKGDRL